MDRAQLEPRDARALRLQLEQARSATEAAQANALNKIRNQQNIEERLAREEHLDAIAHPRGRAQEARSEVGTLLGILRCESSTTTPSGDILLSGELLSLDAIIERLWTALDRLDRAIDGESYIAQNERLSAESNGVYDYKPPPSEALPPDLNRPVK